MIELKEILDVEDFEYFKVRIFENISGKYLFDLNGFFERGAFKAETNDLSVICNFTESLGFTHVNKNIFMAEIPVRSYKYDSLDCILINRMTIDSSIILNFGQGETKVKVEPLILLDDENILFTIVSR